MKRYLGTSQNVIKKHYQPHKIYMSHDWHLLEHVWMKSHQKLAFLVTKTCFPCFQNMRSLLTKQNFLFLCYLTLWWHGKCYFLICKSPLYVSFHETVLMQICLITFFSLLFFSPLHLWILITRFYFYFTENEFPLLAGHLKLIKTLFTCEGVDKKGLGKWKNKTWHLLGKHTVNWGRFVLTVY